MKLNVQNHKSVKSTNDEAVKLIKRNKVNPTLITSVIQKKGRGTMNKKWVSKKGNLFLSIFFEINSKKIDFRQYAIFNAHIIRKILLKYSNLNIIIKWPNDLMVQKRKICGILQEVIHFNKREYLIIGIGINTIYSPSGKGFKSIALKKCTNMQINNLKILEDIKTTYEKFLSDIKKYNISYLNKTICKK